MADAKTTYRAARSEWRRKRRDDEERPADRQYRIAHRNEIIAWIAGTVFERRKHADARHVEKSSAAAAAREGKRKKAIKRGAQRMDNLIAAVRVILADKDPKTKTDGSIGGICAVLVIKKQNQGWRPGPGTQDGSLEPKVRTAVRLIKATSQQK